MRLIIKEFLSQLGESGELDRLLPDLMTRMRIVPISRAQVGVRQNGVDVAGIGMDARGVRRLYLFVLKVGDLGRKDWDGGVNTVRMSLNQILDSYLQCNVRPEHRELPITVVICSTGDLKQDVQTDFAGFCTRNNTSSLEFTFWSGDHLAELIDQYLFDEYVIDPDQRADLRRALALIGSRDYDLRHAYDLLKALLLEGAEVSASQGQTGRKRFVRQLKTAALVLEIIFRWAGEAGNLLNAFKVGERCCLWAWEGARLRALCGHRSIKAAVREILRSHQRICEAYFQKLRPYYSAKDGASVFSRENALVTNTLFEQIGVLAEIGLVHLQVAQYAKDEEQAGRAIEQVREVAVALLELVGNNASSGSPRYDGNAIDVALALMLLHAAAALEPAKSWLEELAIRISFSWQTSNSFPISTDSFDDLLSLELGTLDQEQISKLKDLSTLIPVIMHWCAMMGAGTIYQRVSQMQSSVFKDVCFQLWYPDEATESLIYAQPAQYDSGTTEARISFPLAVADFLEGQRVRAQSGNFVGADVFTAVKEGIPVLVPMACRHFRTPVAPQLWLPEFRNA
ncbi:hypothetical protein D7Y42_03855 [Stenotrophomonas maltophilia]|uniref:hypothetical protein n=1 Tax=Stenotrophomonas maltophilia TaxID=40324 RepID=UPI0015DFDA0C|nr:hypothetical protein [Stenotrophomonas maltophilia]EKT4081808.1 hypothetical protein [Stenotrophomonas maltophilia]MBA0369848.1 hypothetical protein [Stenotrophomonas maltophilia]